MKLINVINVLIVGAIFAMFTIAMVSMLSEYDSSLIKQGIVNTVNGPGSNFINK